MLEDRPKNSFFTPTRVVASLTLLVLLLCGFVLLQALLAPSMITIKVSEPAGKTVLSHFVVDGKAESREGIAPVVYRFEANELRYAVVSLDGATPSDVTVSVHDQSGSGGSRTSRGVTGIWKSSWWGAGGRFAAMSPTHVSNMRKSVNRETEAAHEQNREFSGS